LTDLTHQSAAVHGSRSRLKLAIALGSGICMALAAAPLNWWWLAWVALAPLWVLVVAEGRSQKPEEQRQKVEGRGQTVERKERGAGRVCLLPLLWGFGYYGITLFWITGLHPLTWLGVPWLASVAIVLFCWLFITLWGTVPVLLWAWGMRRSQDSPVVQVLLGTGLWVALEWLRNLTPLDWASLSFTQSPGNLVILHLGQLSGPFLVTAGIVAVNGLIAQAWMQWQRAESKSQKSEVRSQKSEVRGQESESTSRGQKIAGRDQGFRWQRCWVGAVVLCLCLHAIGFALYRQPLAEVETQALKVGIIQGNVPTRIKLSGEGIRRAVNNYQAGYAELAAQPVDVVLTPEGALPIYWNPATNPLYQAVLTKKVPLWLGTFVKTDRTITQSLLSLTADGSVVGRYNKVKLVPLGEYIPFPEVLGSLINRLSPIEATMQPGQANQQFNTPFGRAIASICYDSAFPYLFRSQAAQGGEFILTAANLDPYSEVLMAQHQAHDLMRAIETDRWIVRATNTGYSGIIDPHGTILWRSQPQTAQTHSTTIYRRQTQTAYVRWGDWVTPLLGAIATLLLLSQKVSEGRGQRIKESKSEE
jgi:apolipoprotein N-acyltransferase